MVQKMIDEIIKNIFSIIFALIIALIENSSFKGLVMFFLLYIALTLIQIKVRINEK